MNLPRLTNVQYELAEDRARRQGTPLDKCPTCENVDRIVEVEGVEGSSAEHYGVEYAEPGQFWWRGELRECDCDLQRELRKHYLVADIPDQYMRLDWQDYEGPEKVKSVVSMYLQNWKSAKKNGMGLEFGGVGLGVGKTFGATHVGKELVKSGENVFFVDFRRVLSLYQQEDIERRDLERTLMDTTVLILDEVLPPLSNAQETFFSVKLEELIRHRTNHNLPTIITTNLTAERLDEVYPRPYSLLTAKQIRLDLTGTDRRKGKISEENFDILTKCEFRPIT